MSCALTNATYCNRCGSQSLTYYRERSLQSDAAVRQEAAQRGDVGLLVLVESVSDQALTVLLNVGQQMSCISTTLQRPHQDKLECFLLVVIMRLCAEDSRAGRAADGSDNRYEYCSSVRNVDTNSVPVVTMWVPSWKARLAGCGGFLKLSQSLTSLDSKSMVQRHGSRYLRLCR